MPFEIITLSESDSLSLYDADMLAVGEAFARLAHFMGASDSLVAFKCDAGAFTSLKRAAATWVGTEKVGVREQLQARTGKTNKQGIRAFAPVTKGAKVPANVETRTVTISGYTPAMVRESIKTLRESHGVAIKRLAGTNDDGSIVAALVRTTDESQATEES